MKIYQLTNITPFQMMCYVIKTDGGKVIVIDGGHRNQWQELYRILEKVGFTVDTWFLTHIHCDHFNAIIELLENHPEIKVNQLIRNRNESILGYLNEGDLKEINRWYDFEAKTDIPLVEAKLSQKITVDNVELEILGIENPELTSNIINNQSMVIRMTDGDFSVLFLGDLGVEGGEKLLFTQGEKIKSDCVQMAHHGQRGVAKEIYEAIGPKYALWPTPKWLWDNTKYLGEPGQGPFKTPEVIGWMQELGTVNITSFEHTTLFDTKTKQIENV